MSQRRNDKLLIWTLRTCAIIAGVIVLFVTAFLILESLPALKSVGIIRFFSDSSWHPAENLYNLTPILWGTLLVMFGSVLIATPLGILSAIFVNYYAPPKIAHSYRMLLGLLAGIPSVVYGFWGLVVLVPLIGQLEPPGPSLLAGILILSIMILPTIALVSDSSFSNVPKDYITSATSLGLSRWTTIRHIILPTAKSGLFTGTILETGRAIGETMAVLMVCGNVVQIPKSVFEPVRTLTANIALEMAYALGDHRSALFVSGLLLMIIVAGLIIAAEWISRGRIYA